MPIPNIINRKKNFLDSIDDDESVQSLSTEYTQFELKRRTRKPFNKKTTPPNDGKIYKFRQGEAIRTGPDGDRALVFRIHPNKRYFVRCYCTDEISFKSKQAAYKHFIKCRNREESEQRANSLRKRP